MPETMTTDPAPGPDLAAQLAEAKANAEQYRRWWNEDRSAGSTVAEKVQQMEARLAELPAALNQLAELHVAVARQQGYRTDQELLDSHGRNAFALSIGTQPSPADALTPWQERRAEQLAKEAQEAQEHAEMAERRAEKHRISLGIIRGKLAEMEQSRKVVEAEAALARAQGHQDVAREKDASVTKHDEAIAQVQGFIDADDGGAAECWLMFNTGGLGSWRDKVR